MPALSNLVNPTKIVAAVLFNTIMTRLSIFNFVLLYFMNYDSMMQRLWLSSSTVLLMMKYSTLKLMQYYLFLDDEMHTIEREKEKNKDKVASCLVYMENLLFFLAPLDLLLYFFDNSLPKSSAKHLLQSLLQIVVGSLLLKAMFTSHLFIVQIMQQYKMIPMKHQQ